jgi:hypothetical protein
MAEAPVKGLPTWAMSVRACMCSVLLTVAVSARAVAQADTVRRGDSTRRGGQPPAGDTARRDSAQARLPTVKVRAARPLTGEQRRLDRAKALGGRIIAAKSISAAAPTSRTLGDLMRRTAGAMVQVVAGYGASTCLLVQRNANLQQRQSCALLVVDEVVSMGDAYVAPTDVDLIVVVPASAAMVRFGERGRYGAVAVYTRAGRDDPP